MVHSPDRTTSVGAVPPPETLDLTSAAAYLGFTETEVARLAHLGEIPTARTAGCLIFTPSDLDAYLRRKSYMTQWEYMFVEVVEERRVPRPWTMNGEEIPNWKNGPSIYAFTADMGREGWELISAPSNAKGTLVGLVFKRPRSGP